MMTYMMRAVRKIATFRRREEGTATVEAVLWFPIFIAVFGLMVDAALVFHGQAKVLRIVQDGNRNLSIGRLTTTTEAETYIETVLAQLNITADASSTITAGVVTTTVSVQTGQLQVVGFFPSLARLTIDITADHMIENWEA
jgi:Flp pilus assembly protein TadG